MRVWAFALGGYPRNKQVRGLLRSLERGQVPPEEVERGLSEASAALIGAQQASGMAYVVDGMLDWHDAFRPFVGAWRNVTATGLLRYFDNNFFYRVPLFTDKPEAATYVWAPRIRKFSPLADPWGLKAVIPGPVTFAHMSNAVGGLRKEELADSISRIMEAEAKAAAEAGAKFIQVDEPILADVDATPDMATLASELATRIAKAAPAARSSLAIYFGVPEPQVYERALDARVDYISIDFADAPERALALVKSKGFGGHWPILGLINARNVYDDPLDKLRELVAKALEGQATDEVGLTTSTWLDLIPYEYSLRKTMLLGLLAEGVAKALGAEHVRRG
ncbi:MAG: methylcobalamin--homocysteine methyltransferase [Desulfurococcaceae archaeon]